MTKQIPNFNVQKILLLLALAASVAGAVFVTQSVLDIDREMAKAEEAARPVKVSIVKITAPNCADCFNVEASVGALKSQHVFVSDERAVPFDSDEGKRLIAAHGITQVPTYIATGEVKSEKIAAFVAGNGEVRGDVFVFTKVQPVFIDTASGEEKGRIELVFLTDKSCKDCYDTDAHRQILVNRFGTKLRTERKVDMAEAEGRALVQKYAITKVPTVLLSPEAGAYAALQIIWGQVGTVQEDGWYVFREVSQMGGVYKDLSTNKIVRPAAATSVSTETAN
ncbi:MAG: hypothetical protein AAB562_04275 [Patescibacteria group bacterium]|mgnify:CR=1 FL=1